MTRRGSAVYRALLWLLPQVFRERFGVGMEELFTHRLSTARGAAKGWVWLRGTVDVLGHAVLERFRPALTRDRAHDSVEDGMGTMMQEARWALRSLRRAPLFAAMAMLTLALGIGASTATFSVVSTVLFKPLPYRDPGRLVTIWPRANFNLAMVREALADMPAIEAVSGISGWGLTLVGEGDPIQVSARRVSPSHFAVLGARPALGRDFTEEEGLPGRDDVVILSHGFWMRVFGGDPDAIGRRIRLSGADTDTRLVVGVMPAGFQPIFGDPEVWIPMALDPAATLASDDSWYVNYRVARLAPGATVEQAREQVARFARRVEARIPDRFDEDDLRQATVEPMHTYLARDMGPVMWAALAAVSLVLLIACANVANLLLARGDARAHELAVRTALGAGRRSVVRMLLAECAVLGIVGGGIGILASFGLVRVVTSLAPANFPRIDEVAVDAPVLAWAVAITLLATLLAGLVPALRVSRVDATSALGGATRGSSARRRSGLTLGLVGVEVALAVVVTVGSGLMVRSLVSLTSTDIGIDPRGILALELSPPGDRYRGTEDYVRYYDDVMARVAALPEVEAVGANHLLPGTENNWSFATFPEGIDVPDGSPPPVVNFRMVQGDYFGALGLAPRRGRLLTAQDRADAEKVLVVNQAFADRYWPGEDPLGRAVRLMTRDTDPFRIVGVVGNVRQHGYARAAVPEVYVPMAQWSFGTGLWLLVRVRGDDPLAAAPAVQAAVWSVDRDVPISGLEELAGVFARSAASTRFLTMVLGSFGVLALLLGAIGVFGVTAYAVGRRTSEFGVRLALGSSRRSVLGAALLTCSRPVLAGLVVGILAAMASSRVLASVLYAVKPGDPLTLMGVGVTMLLVAVLASLLPAWRASRVDPVQVLGAE